jgi:hypothetical protein
MSFSVFQNYRCNVGVLRRNVFNEVASVVCEWTEIGSICPLHKRLDFSVGELYISHGGQIRVPCGFSACNDECFPRILLELVMKLPVAHTLTVS